ncbi:HMG domain-containing protein 3-like [Mus musculus]|uniref:HMG domain-containing protein 3-like n=1 Tax=Mus musculus TaxID=10090 RepID=UPI0011AE1F35|nr:HMG domain-containing protein 3-like [Mus musculus]
MVTALLSLQSVPTEAQSVALARGSHAITRAGRFRCAARAAGTGLPGDQWCAVASATSAPVPRRLVSLLPSSGFPGPDPRGPRQASAEPVREPAALRSPFTTRQRDSDSGSERDCGDSAPCVAGRGRGAGAPPAPGMRARALASTFSLPLSRVEPPLAYSGERECTDQQHPCRAPVPGTPGNVSREARKLLRIDKNNRVSFS